MTGAEKQLTQQKLKLSQPDPQLILNALYITVVAAFEDCLRQFISVLTEEFTKRAAKWDIAYEPLIKLNIRESAKLLHRMDSPPDYMNFDIWETCRQLGTCHPRTTAVILNAAALSEAGNLIKLESFFERIAVFGVDMNFDELGKVDLVCTCLSLTKKSARNNAKQIEGAIREIARFRNRIAHTGMNASDVTEEILNRDTKLLQSLIITIDSSIATVLRV